MGRALCGGVRLRDVREAEGLCDGRTQRALAEQVAQLFDVALRAERDAGGGLLPVAAMLVSLSAEGQATSVAGEVSITASEAIAAYLLPPVVRRIRNEHPHIEVEVVASNEARDLRRREADIAVRNFQPTEADLVGRKVAESIAYFYAATSYLERVGPIDTPDQLCDAELFAFDRTDVMVDTLRSLGLEVSHDQFHVVTSNHLVQWEMCKRGLGLCMMMREVGDAEPLVERVFHEISFPVPLWLVAHRELRTNRRIRIAFDILAEELGG